MIKSSFHFDQLLWILLHCIYLIIVNLIFYFLFYLSRCGHCKKLAPEVIYFPLFSLIILGYPFEVKKYRIIMLMLVFCNVYFCSMRRLLLSWALTSHQLCWLKLMPMRSTTKTSHRKMMLRDSQPLRFLGMVERTFKNTKVPVKLMVSLSIWRSKVAQHQQRLNLLMMLPLLLVTTKLLL